MSEPFTCPGCHGGDFPDFDHFCDALNVTDAEAPHAFAAWMANTTEWDGDYGPVAPGGGIGDTDKPPEPSTEMICRCNGTGWVRISIPPELQDTYSMAKGWAGCNIEAHRMNANDEPPGAGIGGDE